MAVIQKLIEPGIAYLAASYGMRNGIFTKHPLGMYINGKQCDYYNARKIINGLNKAALIDNDARKIEILLRLCAR